MALHFVTSQCSCSSWRWFSSFDWASSFSSSLILLHVICSSGSSSHCLPPYWACCDFVLFRVLLPSGQVCLHCPQSPHTFHLQSIAKIKGGEQNHYVLETTVGDKRNYLSAQILVKYNWYFVLFILNIYILLPRNDHYFIGSMLTTGIMIAGLFFC